MVGTVLSLWLHKTFPSCCSCASWCQPASVEMFEDSHKSKAGLNLIPPTLRYLSLITELHERPTASVSPQSWELTFKIQSKPFQTNKTLIGSVLKLCPFFSNALPSAIPRQWPRARQSMEASPCRMEKVWEIPNSKKLGVYEVGGLDPLDPLEASEAPAGWGSCWTIDADIVGVCLAHSK